MPGRLAAMVASRLQVCPSQPDHTRPVEVENQADCLMGIFSNEDARTSDWVRWADFRDAIKDARASGDDPDAPTAEHTHGTPDHRVEAFLRGYRAKSLSARGI